MWSSKLSNNNKHFTYEMYTHDYYSFARKNLCYSPQRFYATRIFYFILIPQIQGGGRKITKYKRSSGSISESNMIEERTFVSFSFGLLVVVMFILSLYYLGELLKLSYLMYHHLVCEYAVSVKNWISFLTLFKYLQKHIDIVISYI